MKAYWGFGVLLMLASPLAAQGRRTGSTAVEGMIGVANLNESFTSDCCGPTRGASGTSASLRAKRRVAALAELGAEGGATFAGQRNMKWLMAIASLATPTRLAPWVQAGAGLIAQPGECPADGYNYGPGCNTDLNLGGAAAVGVRWTVRGRLAVGLEATLLRGAIPYRDRWFTTERLGVTLRWQ